MFLTSFPASIRSPVISGERNALPCVAYTLQLLAGVNFGKEEYRKVPLCRKSLQKRGQRLSPHGLRRRGYK
jgi:hypothetical protein